MPKKDVHIIPRDSGWAVRREGATRDSSLHDRKVDAVDAGRTTARRDHVELVTHAKDGRIARVGRGQERIEGDLPHREKVTVDG